MLKQSGFGLLEMLLVLVLASILMIASMQFLPLLYHHVLQWYQQQRLMQTIHTGLLPMIKDVKRAGFMAKPEISAIEAQQALTIHQSLACIIIRYDFSRIGKWSILASESANIDTFAYRYHKHNIEYISGIADCAGHGWVKLFDENEISITALTLINQPRYLNIMLSACLIHRPAICYQYQQMIRYENR